MNILVVWKVSDIEHKDIVDATKFYAWLKEKTLAYKAITITHVQLVTKKKGNDNHAQMAQESL